MPDPTNLTPVPLDLMIRHALDDGGDYNDGIGGYVGGSYDATAGILTLKYERADGEPVDPDDDDYNHSSTEYRFKLIPEIAS